MHVYVCLFITYSFVYPFIDSFDYLLSIDLFVYLRIN